MKNIIVLQDELKDCGISCLLSIIHFYNGNVSKEYLRDLTKTDNNGVNAFNLVEASKILGFDSKGVKGTIYDLKKDMLPIIAHIKINNLYHFIVIYKIDFKKEIIYVMDPSYGMKKISFDKYNRLTTNNYIYLKPIKKIPCYKDNNKIFNLIKNLITKYQSLLIKIFIFSLFYTIINIISSYNFKLLLEDINLDNITNITKIFVILIIFILIKLILNLFRNNLINYINYALDKTLFNDIYSHIINLPYAYYKNRTTGDVITRINDLSNVKDLIQELFLSIFVDLILVIFIVIVLLNINKTLTLISIIIIILYSLIILVTNKSLNNYIRESYQNNSIINTYLIETISNVDTIKSLSLQNYSIDNMNNKYLKLSNINLKLTNFINKEKFAKDLIYYIGELIIIFMGTKLIKTDSMTVIELITFISLLSYFMTPIKNIVDLNLIYKNAKQSLYRIKELYLLEEEKLNYKNIINFKGHIYVNRLSYSYNGIDKVINNVSLLIEPGNKVLIYGTSGSGKSTLMKLLIKYLDNYEGLIEIDGINLNNITLTNLRDRICYVSQNEGLFTDTVYNNIVLDNEISYTKFLEIADLTRVSEIVKKDPNGYDKLIEENGFNLSGGEKQRIILARSIVKEKDIYIFDEALNAIDIAKERLILKRLFELYKNKTIIIISHRFNNSDLFDLNIHVKDGNYEREYI